MYQHLVIHYSEIGLKGGNRSYFEKKLLDNIRWKLRGEIYTSLKRVAGRIILTFSPSSDQKSISLKLQDVIGISSFSFALVCKPSLEELEKAVLQLVQPGVLFKIKSKRSDKNFPKTSLEINEHLGSFLQKKGFTPEILHPQQLITVEMTQQECYVYHERIEGLRGLPVGVSGKMVSLLSGGIDSPVASFLLMKRGCSVVFIHFFTDTAVTTQVKQKVVSLVEVLSKYQFKSTLYLVPFLDLQKEIIKHVPSELRMIVYRRYMLKIAEHYHTEEQAQGFITGDSLAQVASQTPANLWAIRQATLVPIYSPLIGNNKEEIIAIAKKIGTFDISTLPYEDCCSYFIAKHPETKATLEEVLKFETKIDDKKVIAETLKHVQKVVIKHQ